ncbi:hypothetical protein V8Z80_17080 [Orrella sp. JC864]|uniref:hypothetical protein n=1 Tax=Orrella sp. JC864 TaxID=3120298 RepID=UPI00300B4DA3
MIASFSWHAAAQASACSVSLEGISGATAAEYGMRRTAGGYAFDVAALAQRSGGAGVLLAQTNEQLAANMKWFQAMESIVADPDTPMLANIQLLYEQGREAHEVQLALARSLQCQLGIASGPQRRPQTVASLQASHDARVAQARAAQVSQARSESASQGFWNALGTVANVLGAVGSSMAGMQQNAPAQRQSGYQQEQRTLQQMQQQQAARQAQQARDDAARQAELQRLRIQQMTLDAREGTGTGAGSTSRDNCGWTSRPGGGGYCEVVDPGR